MKVRLAYTLFIAATTGLLAQPARPPAAPAAGPTAAPAVKPAAATTTPAATAPATTAGGQSATAGGQQGNGQSAKIDGFDGVAWGVTYKELKDRLRVMAANANAADNLEIVSDTPDREILIRRREIYYRYVFYKKPASKPVESMPKPEAGKPPEKPTETDETSGTAKFFFVESVFPLLKAEELYGKLADKYGQRTGSNVGDGMRGAYTWEKEDGFLVQWVEPYAKGGYTRSLYYLSRKIRDEIRSDLQAWQLVREIKALENLLK